ncbi:MAG: nitrogenase-stabilizing/protective protein NifW [Nitrospirae bacterium]|nr:nitrogenase-stabilizing/protective protein NifW [Nitrospirota bacterium]
MSDLWGRFDKLVNAEDFLDFFEIPYDSWVVDVNRLHVLKKFSLYKQEIDREDSGMTSEERFARYREAMRKAYETFLTSTAPEQRLFKVFQQTPLGLVTIGISRKV